MNVGELKAALADCPDDMPVVVQEDDHRDLDPDVMLDMAVQYAPGRYDGKGRQWRWRAGHGPEADETECLVIY